MITLKKPTSPVDAERMWKQAIDKGLMDPGRVIACADFLAHCKEFKTAAELLKASLRSGLTPERWYQEALAIALEESQGSSEEIERAYVSAIDLEPKNPETYLRVSRSLNTLGEPDAAVRLCRVAAKIEPNVPDAYASALVYAENPKATASYDVTAFAAGGLLAHDWPYDNGELHANARKHLLAAVKKLDAANRKAEAQKVEAMLAEDKNRDLVVEMSYVGPAGIDLRVKEPIGTLCSSLKPMTTAGGSLREGHYDAIEDAHTKVYTASRAFDGTYTIVADHLWGRPLGDKVQIKVIRHQGTPDERPEYYTMDLKRQTKLSISFAGGRRKDVAVLPSAVEMTRLRAKPNQAGQVSVMNKLRALVSGTGAIGLSGGTGSAASSTGSNLVPEKRLGEVTWSTRLGDERSAGLDIRSETTVRPDGTVEVKAAPVFDSLPKVVRAKIDLIPGGE